MTISSRVAARYRLALADREALADLEHDRWTRWMNHQFSKGDFNDDGSWTMPAEFVDRWKRQMATPYDELSESEKDSDRDEVDKTLELIGE